MKLGFVSGFGQQIPPRTYAATETIFWEIANRVSREMDVRIYSKSSSLFPKRLNPNVDYRYLNRALSIMDTLYCRRGIYKKYVIKNILKDQNALIQCNSPFFTDLLSIPGARFIFSCHNAPWSGWVNDELTGKAKDVYLDTLDRSDKVTCVSEFVKKSLSPYVDEKDKLHVIYNGINTKQFKPLPKENVVLCVGRIIPTKGQIHLLKAFSELDTDWKLLMVGTYLAGKDNMEYYKKCLKYRSKNIKFLGAIWGERLMTLYGKARIVAVPSAVQEAFGMTNIEAMSSGCAVISSDVGGIPEIISDRKNGFLVPPGDSGAIKERLEILMENERLRAEMSARARSDAVNLFDWEKIAGQYLEFYRSLS